MKKLFLLAICIIVSPLFSQDSLEVIMTFESNNLYAGPNYKYTGNGGDINGDGYSDLASFVYNSEESSGIEIFLGSSQPDTIPDYYYEFVDAYLYARYSVSVSGDLNGDGYDDLVISAPVAGYNYWGEVYIFWGGLNFDTIPDLTLAGSDYAQDSWGLYFGNWVNSEGDFNNDGYNDLVIGSLGADFFWFGQVDIFYGGQEMNTDVDWHLQGGIENIFGSALGVGDFNGDGFSDLCTMEIQRTVDIEMIPHFKIYLGTEYVMDTIHDAFFTMEEQYSPWPYTYEDCFLFMNGDINNDGYDDICYINKTRANISLIEGNLEMQVLVEELTLGYGEAYNAFYCNINNDEFSDLVVASLRPTGCVQIYAGCEAGFTDPIYEIYGTEHLEFFGTKGCNIGDMNNDGNNDIIVGSKKEIIDGVEKSLLWVLTEEYTNVEDNLNEVYSALEVSNYPNPFNPVTTINFCLPSDSKVSIDIFNIKGQRVVTLKNEYLTAGDHSIVWNGKDESNNDVSSGVFFCRVEAGTKSATNKLLLLK